MLACWYKFALSMFLKHGCAAIINIVRNIRNEHKLTAFHKKTFLCQEETSWLFFTALNSVCKLFKKVWNTSIDVFCACFRSINQRFNYCSGEETSTYVSINLVIPLVRSDGSWHELWWWRWRRWRRWWRPTLLSSLPWQTASLSWSDSNSTKNVWGHGYAPICVKQLVKLVNFKFKSKHGALSWN